MPSQLPMLSSIVNPRDAQWIVQLIVSSSIFDSVPIVGEVGWNLQSRKIVA